MENKFEEDQIVYAIGRVANTKGKEFDQFHVRKARYIAAHLVDDDVAHVEILPEKWAAEVQTRFLFTDKQVAAIALISQLEAAIVDIKLNIQSIREIVTGGNHERG